MTAGKNLDFTVFHSAGKNYAVVLNLKPNSLAWDSLGPHLASPHIGLGVDGLLIVHPSKQRDFDVVGYRSGGEPVPFSANGLAAVTRALALEKIIDPQGGSIEYTMYGRGVQCTFVQAAREVTVDMGRVSFEAEELPLTDSEQCVGREIVLADRKLTVTALELIEPFAVVTAPDVDRYDFDEVASALSTHSMFSKPVNVVGIAPLEDDMIRIASWERELGAQPASALAACAAVVAGVKTRTCVRRTRVLVGNEEVTVTWANDAARIQRTARVIELFSGTIFESYLTSIS